MNFLWSEWGNDGAWLETLAILQAPAHSTFHMLSILPPKEHSIFFLSLLVGIKRLTGTQDTRVKVLRPSDPRNALTGSAKALSQRTVAVALLSWLPWTITTTGRDRVWKRHRGGLRVSPQPHALPFSPSVSITTRASSLHFSKCHPQTQNRNGSRNKTSHLHSLRNLRYFSRDISAWHFEI